NAVRLWGTQNPRFFEGTRVAKEAVAILAAAQTPPSPPPNNAAAAARYSLPCCRKRPALPHMGPYGGGFGWGDRAQIFGDHRRRAMSAVARSWASLLGCFFIAELVLMRHLPHLAPPPSRGRETARGPG